VIATGVRVVINYQLKEILGVRSNTMKELLPQGIILKNGKLQLCSCSSRYGKQAYMDHKEPYRDTVTDLSMPAGYKLMDSINNNWR